jgi:glucosamine-6-phosphate deaminase
MRVIVAEDSEHLGARAAAEVRDGIDTAKVRVLGVATGSSPLSTYRALVDSPPRRIGEVEMFALDEYVGLSAADPRSYRAYLEREIRVPLGLDARRLHSLNGVAEDPEAECASFDRLIAASGGVDLQILGIGANGHIAFNEPGSAPDAPTRVAALDERTRIDNARFFRSLDDVPTLCMTQGLATILRARRILLLASGRAKAAALRSALQDEPDPRIPASFLQGHSDVTVIADRAAASLLTTQGVLP